MRRQFLELLIVESVGWVDHQIILPSCEVVLEFALPRPIRRMVQLVRRLGITVICVMIRRGLS